VAVAASLRGPPAVARWAVPTVAAAAATAAVIAVQGAGLHLTSYAETSPVALGADLAAALAMIAVGAVSWFARPGAAALLAVLIGCAWSAPDWIGREAAPAAVRSVAMVVAPFLPVLVAHLALSEPDRRLPRPARTAVCVGYAATATIALGQALVRDPLFDRYCWQNCADNVFLLRADVDVAQVLAALSGATTVGIGVLAGAVLAHGLLCGRPAIGAGSGRVPALGAAVVLASEAAYALLRLLAPAQEPSDGLFPALFLLRAVALVALAATLAVPAVRILRTRAAVRRLARDLAVTPAPGRLRAALAETLGDGRLEVAYWLDRPQRFVDAEGCPVEPAPASDQVVTTIARGGEPVAIVVHDRTLRERATQLEQTIGSAVRLVVDNERLRAEALFRLQDVRASQARVVARSDATRRTLERNLHDGAQQRLIGVSFQLHAALAAARADGDPAAERLLAGACDQAVTALADVRQLAYGIFPAILSDAGLAPALRTFAAGAALPVEVLEVDDRRCAVEAETAAYVVVVEAVADAARRSAGYATVRVGRHQRRLVVVVADDGSRPDPAALRHVTDRVEALGGRLVLGPGAVRAEIPCG
jgi:signal transduction histidine kinase